MAEQDKFLNTVMCNQLKRIAKSNNQKSWSTKRTYMAELNKICRDLFNRCQVKKLENIKNIQVKNLVEEYIDNGISTAEVKKRLSALRWALNFQNAWLNTKGTKKRCRFTLSNKELGLGNKEFKQRYGIDGNAFKQVLLIMERSSKAIDFKSMAILQYYFGLRSREAVLMNKRTLLNAYKTKTLTLKEGCKGGKKRVLELDSTQMTVVKYLLDTACKGKYTDDYLFVDKSIPKNVASVLKSYQNFFYQYKNALPYTLNPNEYENISSHTLRRSFASNQLVKYRQHLPEKLARQKVIEELGHGKQRTDLLKCYCGGVL